MTTEEEVQNITIAILSVAGKEDALGGPCLSDLVKLGSKNLTKQDLVKLEIKVLSKLGWRLHSVSNA